jgi:hypothetical protein
LIQRAGEAGTERCIASTADKDGISKAGADGVTG